MSEATFYLYVHSSVLLHPHCCTDTWYISEKESLSPFCEHLVQKTRISPLALLQLSVLTPHFGQFLYMELIRHVGLLFCRFCALKLSFLGFLSFLAQFSNFGHSNSTTKSPQQTEAFSCCFLPPFAAILVFFAACVQMWGPQTSPICTLKFGVSEKETLSPFCEHLVAYAYATIPSHCCGFVQP